ncbi:MULTISPECIES: TolC family protein [Enterobacterales]|uniref:TolC family protein n=1 Tax=Enterobacterales TaxID=91347 RepID=UPI000535F970|nr:MULTISPECIES: TolC family protein [Enterobacterales]AIX52702.1 transporter [Pantoea sp. PSNIH1]AIX76623.1 transporter [Pantoea sp. PSNIH2]POU39859.1 TolC family protein [Pantoea sp. PSNIH5]POU58394.1 TolC family protein [Pantoea sp. PSNIH4]POW50752.1 TolC family protein [Pantoea alvi]
MFTSFSRPQWAVGFAVAVTAVLFALPSRAEPAPPYEALIESLDRIPITVEAEALLDAANARAQQARALPNPSVSVETENVYGRGPFSGYDAAESTFSINQPLELWGQRGARIGAAQAEAKVAALRRDQTQWTVAGSLALIYSEAEAASLQYELAVEALELTEADANAVMLLIEEGREPSLRGIQANSEVESARAAVDEARANRDAAFARLTAVAMLVQPVTAIEPSLLNRSPDASFQAMGNPLTVQIAEAELEAASKSVSVERLRARPAVSASLGVRRFQEYDTEAFTFGINVSLPLFDRNKGAISAAHAEERAAAARLTTAKLQTQANRSAAQARLDASITRIRAADKGVASAEEAYQLARAGFDTGRISQLELRSIRSALISARNTAVNARLARVRAEVELAGLDGRAPF